MTLPKMYLWGWLLTLSLALSACHNDNDPPPPPPATEGSATIDSRGGTVNGPDGVKVDIAEGVLSQNTTVRIAKDSTGAPELGGLRLLSPIYQITPHGLEFESPVRISIPVDPANLKSGTAPVVIRTQPGASGWEVLASELIGGNLVAADSSSFSYYAVGECFISRDISVPGPDPIASCPSGHSLSLTLLDGSNVALPQQRTANGVLLPVMTIETPTAIGLDVHWSRPVGTARTDQLQLRNTLNLIPALMRTEDVTTDAYYLQLGNIVIDPATIAGASAPGGRRLLIYASVTYTFDAFYPGCLCWKPTTWTYSAELLIRVVHHGAQPTITQQPGSATVSAGATASFGVAATGSDLTYQWRRSNDGGQSFADINGATGSSYEFATALADSGAQFRARICTNTGTPKVQTCIDSNIANLTVTAAAATAPAFTQQPLSPSVIAGQTASFTVVASGTPAPAVQWYKAGTPDQAVGAPCPAGAGTTSCTYTTGALALGDSGTNYYALAQNSAGQVQSNHVTVTVLPDATAPSIVTQPADQTVIEGGTATFEVVADGTAPLSYQWYRNGQPVSAANGASIALNNVQIGENGDQFYVVVSNSEDTVTSDTVTLAVTQAGSACTMPQAIETAAGEALAPNIVTDAAGNALAVWPQYDGTYYHVYANRYSSGWGTAQLIDNVPGNASTVAPQVAVDGSGNALTVFQHSGSIVANRYTAGSGWDSGTAWLDKSIAYSAGPALALAGSGQGIVVWQEYDGVTDSIYTTHYTPGSGWSAPHTIDSEATRAASSPSVAMDGNGNAIAVWRQYDGTTTSIFANRYNGQEWGTAQTIENLSSEALAPEIAMNANGNAVTVWTQHEGSNRSVYSNTYIPGSGWSTPVLLDPGTSYATEVHAAIDGSGNAIAVWRQYDSNRHRIYVRRYVPGSGWNAVQQLQSPDGGDAWEPQIAMDTNGNAVVLWMQWRDTTFGIFGNRYVPGSGWGGAKLFADATNDVSAPHVALDGNGRITAVWQEGDGQTKNIKAVRCQ